jgi:hypothetical protein
MAIDPAALTGLVAGLGAVGWMIYDKNKEKRNSKEFGLKENPNRCREHAAAINEIREDVRRVKEHLGIV